MKCDGAKGHKMPYPSCKSYCITLWILVTSVFHCSISWPTRFLFAGWPAWGRHFSRRRKGRSLAVSSCTCWAKMARAARKQMKRFTANTSADLGKVIYAEATMKRKTLEALGFDFQMVCSNSLHHSMVYRTSLWAAGYKGSINAKKRMMKT